MWEDAETPSYVVITTILSLPPSIRLISPFPFVYTLIIIIIIIIIIIFCCL